MKSYFVYILTNHSKTLYIGVTNSLERRVYEHRMGLLEGFAKKYRINQLIYFEESSDITAAIAREKQLKKWSRIKKIALIEKVNPGWKDLNTDLSTTLEMTSENIWRTTDIKKDSQLSR